MTYVHPSAARTVAVYPKLPLFQALRMRQEEQCPATTTECGRLRTGAHKRMERINQKEKKQQQQTLSSLMFIVWNQRCLNPAMAITAGQAQRPSTKEDVRHQHRKLQPPPLQASCCGSALPGHRIRELVEGHIQMPQPIAHGACTTRKSITDFEIFESRL